MGGAAYLESRQEAAAFYGEETPTLDDTVGELAGAMDALLSGDETRFHMETVYHSEDEIERMLALGQKLTRTTVAVQDDDGEEERQRIDAELRAAAELSEQAARRMLDEDDEEERRREIEKEEFEQYHGFGMSMGMSM